MTATINRLSICKQLPCIGLLVCLLAAQTALAQTTSPRIPTGNGPSAAMLENADSYPQHWLYHTGNYSGTRYSALDQVAVGNAADLQVACIHQIGGSDYFQTGPLVYDGVIYLTAGSKTLAVSGDDCRLLWSHDWEYQSEPRVSTNRGVAIQDGYVVRGMADGFLVTLDAADGSLLWANQVADSAGGEHFTMAPLIWRDRIFIGPAGGNFGISGWLGAFSLHDGSPLWKFHTVPGALGEEDSSWENPLGIRIGGGALWTPLSFDPGQQTLYVAVTNPAPDFPADLRPGDNLYTNSVVALDAEDGSLRWYRQFIANDDHGWDITQVSPLWSADAEGGTSLMAVAGKDGLLRVLDRDNQAVLVETAVGLRENVSAPVTTAGTYSCPGVFGGVLWNGPALVPQEGLLVTPSVNLCATFYLARETRYIEGVDYFGGTVVANADTLSGWISATDWQTGELSWRYESPLPVVAAVTSTAGGLVLAGELTGDFIVLSAETGEKLYSFNTGGAIGGGIVTYEVDGRQYIAVVSGRPSPTQVNGDRGSPTLLVFALPE